MRDYTRKAKIKDSNEWVIGYHVYVDYLDKHYILASEKTHDGFSGMLAMKQYEVDGDTICNPTGLTDKNGNKIWENDVVKDDRGNIYKAFWQERYYQFSWICVKSDLLPIGAKWDLWSLSRNGNLEVIGNIFDNADLLKGE